MFSNRRRQQNRYVDIRTMIYVDSNVLNYSTFYPGKMLGSTLSVGNLSDCEQIVELSVDSNNLSYQKSVIREKFENLSLPFSIAPTPGVDAANDTVSDDELTDDIVETTDDAAETTDDAVETTDDAVETEEV